MGIKHGALAVGILAVGIAMVSPDPVKAGPEQCGYVHQYYDNEWGDWRHGGPSNDPMNTTEYWYMSHQWTANPHAWMFGEWDQHYAGSLFVHPDTVCQGS